MSDANLERITILLQARDRDFARAMDRNNKLVARLSRDSTRNMQTMQRQVEGSFARMGTAATAFGTSFVRGLAVGAVTGAIAGITASVRGAVSTLSSMGKAARDAGIDVEYLQGLQRGFARSARVTAEEVTEALVGFNTRVGQALEGDGQFARIAERYGIALRGPNGELRTQAELLREVAQRIRAAGSEAERAAIAQGAFGQVGRRMAQAMTSGATALDDMVTQARSAGDIIDRNLINRAEILDDKFDALTRRVGTFFRTLAVSALAGGAETATDTLIRMFGTLERAQAILGDGVFQALINEMGELQELDGVAERLERVARNSEGLQMAALRTAASLSDVTSQLSDLGMVDELLAFDEIANGMEQLVAELRRGEISAQDFERKLEEVAGEAVATMQEMQAINGLSLSDAIRQVIGLTGALDAARAEARGLRAELPGGQTGPGALARLGARLRGFANDPMGVGGLAPTTAVRPRPAPPLLGEPVPPARGGGGGGGGGGGADGFARTVEDIQARTRALEMEAAALIAVAGSGREYGDAVEYARTRAQLMTQAMAEGREITPQLQAEIDRLAEAYVTAGQSAAEAAETMDRVRENSERGIDAMTDLFMGIAQGGDAARQAVVRLLLELARVQAFRGMSGLAGGKGGGFFSLLGGLLGRSAGGGVRAGEPYLVNENTPNSEVFVPSRSGGVLNVAQAKDALRGQGGGETHVVVELRSDMLDARIEGGAGRVVRAAGPGLVGQAVQATHASFDRRAPA
jgi:hypothetical protein